MSRMNLKKKLELMNEFESYWDMLPLEIQDYIVQMKISQQTIDEDRKDLMQRLCCEIKLYAQLKAKWGLGHVKCKGVKCNCRRYFDLKITGYYVNEDNNKCERYLGHGYEQALSRVNHVKSFL